jgi:hypothetical protein
MHSNLKVIMQAVLLRNLCPALPDWVRTDAKVIAESCWNPDVNDRLSFDEILSQLSLLLSKELNITPLLLLK